MRLYILVDVDTGEELAFHAQNGDTLRRWQEAAEDRGHVTEIREIEE